MACLIHKWNGCKCEKCGKTRDRDHDFRWTESGCEQKCAVCGTVKQDKHSYAAGYCEKCGKRAPLPVRPGLTPEETAEMKPVLIGYAQYCGNRSGGEAGTRLSLMYNRSGAFRELDDNSACTQEHFINIFETYRNLENGAFSLKQARTAAVTARKAQEMLSALIRDVPEGARAFGASAKTLTELERTEVPGSIGDVMRGSRELYQTGMDVNPRSHYTAVRGTADLLDSAAGKTERAIGAYLDEAARRGDTDEDIDLAKKP